MFTWLLSKTFYPITLSIPGIACNQACIWSNLGTSNLFFIILISLYPMGQPAHLEECLEKKISCSPKITLVQSRKRLCQERPFVTPSVAPSIALPDFSQLSESGDELSDQPAGPSKGKPLANSLAAANSIPKYFEDDLQQIFKAVLEAQAPAPAPTPIPAPVVSEVPWEKLKARFPNVYCRKSHIDCYNFCQQCEDHFATAGATGPTQILFAASFLWDRISFH